MKKFTLLALTLLICALPCFAAPGAEFTIKKVDVDNSLTSPDYQLANGTPGPKWSAQKWVKMEVNFEAVPDFTDELTFTYYVLFADRLLVGHVNHVNIANGHDLHSVMYISPKAIQRIVQKKQGQINMANLPISMVTVTISKPGVVAPLAVGNSKAGARADWWTQMKQEEGFLVNKSETPFAPLYWDYYEAIKSVYGR